jgi:hypothetical protein
MFLGSRQAVEIRRDLLREYLDLVEIQIPRVRELRYRKQERGAQTESFQHVFCPVQLQDAFNLDELCRGRFHGYERASSSFLTQFQL